MSNDHQDQGKYHKIYLRSKIGEGSYGKVYKCTNNYGDNLAVKIIKCEKINLVEPAIMSTIHSPYLNYSLNIKMLGNYLYMVQELAMSDLKKYRMDNTISDQIMIQWIYSITKALDFLHSKAIIHGDVKASNVLIYNNINSIPTVKLSDFSLSTKTSWSKKYKPCTNINRPVEAWSSSSAWDEKVDIWSLGCTIYYMIYGENLFHNQEKKESLLALKEWSNINSNNSNNSNNRIFGNIFYYSPNLIQDINVMNKHDIKRLVLLLLLYHAKDRPDTNNILSMDIFDEMLSKPSLIINKGFTEFNSKTKQRIMLQMEQVLVSNSINKYANEIIDIAYKLYISTVGIIHISDNSRMNSCICIAYNMIYGLNKYKKVKYEKDNITSLKTDTGINEFNIGIFSYKENLICDYLGYNLLNLSEKNKLFLLEH